LPADWLSAGGGDPADLPTALVQEGGFLSPILGANLAAVLSL
jgi:hypothetical protein